MRANKKSILIALLTLCISLIAWSIAEDMMHRKVLYVATYPANEVISLPYRAPSDPSVTERSYYLQISQPSRRYAAWHIAGDDCISYIAINSKTVNLKRYKKEDLCDYSKGRNFDFSKYIVPGINHVSITVTDTGGDTTLDVYPSIIGSLNFFPYYYRLYLPLLFISGWACLMFLSFKDRYISTIASIAGVFWVGILLSYNISDRATDWWGHVEYVHFMARNFLSIPAPRDGWQYYQQPLYYFIAGRLINLGAWLEINGEYLVRYFSLACIMVFQYFGVKLITELVIEKSYQRYAVLCLTFAPLMIGLSGRVSNEVMLYALWSACLYYSWRWFKRQDYKYFVICTVLLGLAFIVKTSALVPAFTFGIVILKCLLDKKITWRYFSHKAILAALVLLMLGVGFNFGRTAYYKYTSFEDINLFVGNYTMDSFKRVVPNNRENLLPNQWTSLIHSPFLNYYGSEESGSHNFWISYIKSISFGDFPISQTILAQILNICMACFIFVGIASLLSVQPHREPETMFLLIGIISILLAHFIFHILLPSTATNDARFTYPVIILLYCNAALIPSLYGYVSNPWLRSIAFFNAKLLEFMAIICVLNFMAFLFL